MKLLRRICAAILLATMTLSQTVAAAPFIDETHEGSITIHKMVSPENSEDIRATGERLDNNTVVGKDVNNNDITLGDLMGLNGISFEIYTAELISGKEKGSVNPLDYNLTLKGTKTTATIGSEDGVIVFSQLPVGVYVIKEKSHPSISSPVDDFVVHIPMTDPTKLNEWMYDIHVYPKNQTSDEEPDIEKKVYGKDYFNNPDASAGWQDQTSHAVNDTFSWQLKVKLPSDFATYKEFEITDPIPDFLDYDQSSLSIIAYDAYGKPVTVELTNGNPDQNDLYVDQPDVSNNNTLKIDFGTDLEADNTNKKIVDFATKMAGNDSDPGNVDSNPKMTLVITFNTKITEDWLDEDDWEYDPITNTVYLNWENGFGTTGNKDDDAEVYTGGLKVVKVEKGNHSKLLAGAEFALYGSYNNAETSTNPIATDTTSPDGEIVFEGLEYGIYYLVETKAPEGYNLLDKILTVYVGPYMENGAWATTTVNGSTIISIDAYPLETVENSSQFLLPITGGSGTILFTVIGIILIGTAILIFSVSKKRRKI